MPTNERTPQPVTLGSRQVRDLRLLFEEATVTMLGGMYWTVDDTWHMVERRLQDTFLFFPVKGEMVGMAGGITRPLLPGQFMMVPEGVLHAGWLPVGTSSLDVIALHCHVFDRWRRPLVARFPKPFGELAAVEPWLARLKLLVTLLNTAPAAGQSYGEAVVKELLASLLHRGIRLRGSGDPPDPRIELAVSLIRQRYGEPLMVEDLARETALSAVQFRRLFRRHVGQTPKAYLAHYRVQAAARLLKTTSLTVKEIAARTGHANDHYFHLVFRHHYQCTATDYRRRGPGPGAAGP